jgi:multicomponent K+:H+ antiporter subunit D
LAVFNHPYMLIFGDDAGSLVNMANDWFWPIALLTRL